MDKFAQLEYCKDCILDRRDAAVTAIAVKALQFARDTIARVRGWSRILGDSVVRERALASAVFAGIFAFGVVSLDYLITGGPDWNPGAMGQAYAMELSPHHFAATQTPADRSGSPPPLRPTVEEIDYSVPTEVLLGGPSDWIESDFTYDEAAVKVRDETLPREATPEPGVDEPVKLKLGASGTAAP